MHIYLFTLLVTLASTWRGFPKAIAQMHVADRSSCLMKSTCVTPSGRDFRVPPFKRVTSQQPAMSVALFSLSRDGEP